MVPSRPRVNKRSNLFFCPHWVIKRALWLKIIEPKHITHFNNIPAHNSMTYTPRWTLKLDWTKDQEMFFGEQACTSRNGSSNRYFPFVKSMNHNSTTDILNTSISEPLGKHMTKLKYVNISGLRWFQGKITENNFLPYCILAKTLWSLVKISNVISLKGILEWRLVNVEHSFYSPLFSKRFLCI